MHAATFTSRPHFCVCTDKHDTRVPNVAVHLYDVIIDPQTDEVYMIMEFVSGGPSQKCDAEGKPIPLPEATIWSHTVSAHLVTAECWSHS